MFLFTQIVLGITLLGNLFLLSFLYKGSKNATLQTFSVFLLSVTIWTAAIFANLWLESLLIEQIIFASASIFLIAELWFAMIFPKKKFPKSILFYATALPALGLFILSCIPGTLFQTIAIHSQGYTILDTGPYSNAYSLTAFVYMWTPVCILLVRWLKEKEPVLRKQFRFLCIGFFLFVAVNIFTNSLLPVFFGIFIFNALGPVFFLVLTLFIFYLIRQHEFFNIRKTLQRGVTYSLSLAGILACYITVLTLLERVTATAIAAPLSALALLIVGIYTVPIIEKHFTKWTDRFFFKEQYNYPEALETLSAILHKSIDFETLITQIEETLKNTLRATDVTIILSEAPKQCDKEHIALAEHITLNNETIGRILVYEKMNGDAYTEDDRHLLTTFALNAATALGRARLFQEIQQYANTLEERVSERTKQIETLHENQRQMLFDIAHGLQTPLAVFKTQVEEMQIKESDTLHRSLMDLSHFITDLLTLAQLENESVEKTELISLSQLLTDVFEEVSIIAEDTGVSVTANITPNVYVHGAAQELRSVFINLASNALKYMRRGGPRTITCSLSAENDVAQIVVSDTGIGIPKEDLPHIFTRFYRVSTPKKTVSGNGLGLAITKRIVERHGGTMRVESTLGVGSQFTLSLPLR